MTILICFDFHKPFVYCFDTILFNLRSFALGWLDTQRHGTVMRLAVFGFADAVKYTVNEPFWVTDFSSDLVVGFALRDDAALCCFAGYSIGVGGFHGFTFN